MRKIFYSLFTLSIMFGMNAFSQNKESGNSILAESKAPFGAPEFDKFKIEDYKPAFDYGFAEKRADIKAIIENKEEPTYANTIVYTMGARWSSCRSFAKHLITH